MIQVVNVVTLEVRLPRPRESCTLQHIIESERGRYRYERAFYQSVFELVALVLLHMTLWTTNERDLWSPCDGRLAENQEELCTRLYSTLTAMAKKIDSHIFIPVL